MKQLAAIIFMGCFLSLTFSRPLLLFNFYLNQDAIIARFCVNKDKPQLHCDGKCFLAKKIKEQERREAGNNLLENTRVEVPPVYFTFYETLCPPAFDVVQVYNIFTINHFPSGKKGVPFRPPCA